MSPSRRSLKRHAAKGTPAKRVVNLLSKVNPNVPPAQPVPYPPCKPIKFRQLGGWDFNLEIKDPRHLYRVTIKTSIENWDEWVLARDREEVDRWLAIKFPTGWCPGWEPEVVRMNVGMDGIWITK